jgi:DNA-binding LacI/PurR family transcriptional regulator
LSIAGAAGPAVPERLAAFRDEVHRGGLTAEERFLPAPAERIRPSDCAVSTFYHTLRASDDWTGQATALLCYNDQMALAAGLVLRDRGIVVPRDISLVGFDDAQALYAVPPLTTITHGFAQMGAAAVDLLERMIATPAPTRPTGVTRVPAELIIRESTAPPAGPLRASPTAAAHTRGPTPNATP